MSSELHWLIVSSNESQEHGLSVFGLPLLLDEYLELLSQVAVLKLRPLESLENFGPRLGSSQPVSPMNREAKLEHMKQRLEIRRQICAARQRVVSVTGEAFRRSDFGWWMGGSSTARDEREAQSLNSVSRQVDQARMGADVSEYVYNLILHAESEGIAVTWGSFPYFLGGFVMRRRAGPQVIRRDPETAPALVDATELQRVTKADVMVMLNYDQGWARTFDVLLHELAHVLLGHLGAMRGAREGRLTTDPFRFPTGDVMEFEAISVNYMVSAAMCTVNQRLERHLSRYFRPLDARGEARLVNVLEVFIASEILCAWCASPPDRNGVSARTSAGPTLPLSGQRGT